MTILMCFVVGNSIAQEINDFKYVVVPKKFDGFKNENQYQTSTLVKFLFSEEGFETAYADDLPLELNTNRCMALYAKLADNSNMFTTKTSLILEDCQGREVFKTQEGKSKEKDYKSSYGEAIREAFVSVKGLNYAYSGKSMDSRPVTVNFQNDVKNIKSQKETVASAKNLNSAVEQKATMQEQSYKDRTPQPSNIVKAKSKETVVEQKYSQEEQTYVNKTPQPSQVKSTASESQMKKSSGAFSGVLYAQEIENGLQLVDSTPKIRLKIFKTSMTNYFLAEGEGKSGIVFEKEGVWVFEYQDNGNTVSEPLEIKF